MVSGFGLKGLTDGLIRGAQAGRQVDNWQWQDKRREREQERWQQQDELAELNQTLKKNQLEQLKDEQFRQEYKRHIRFLRYAADQAMDPETGQEWQERVKRDKQLQKDLAESWQVVTGPIVNRGGPEGARKSFAGWVPMEDGRVAPRVKVEREDGETYTAPMTANRDDDPDDEVMAFSPAEIPAMLAQGERLAEMVDAYAARAGMDYPFEQQQAEREFSREQAATQAEREYELAKIRLKDRLKRERSRDGVGGGDMPARIEVVEWIAQNLTGGNKERAWELAERDSQDLLMELYKAEKEAQSNRISGPDLSNEELMNRARETYRMLRQDDPLGDDRARRRGDSQGGGARQGGLGLSGLERGSTFSFLGAERGTESGADGGNSGGASVSAPHKTPKAVQDAPIEEVRKFIEAASAEDLDALPDALRSAYYDRLTGGQ